MGKKMKSSHRDRNIWVSKDFCREYRFTLPPWACIGKVGRELSPLCVEDHVTVSMWNDLVCLKWLRVLSPLCLLVLMMACVTTEEVCRVDVDFAPAIEPVPAEDSALAEFCWECIWISQATLDHFVELLDFCGHPWICLWRIMHVSMC